MFRLFLEICLLYISGLFGGTYHIRCPFLFSLLHFFIRWCLETVSKKLAFNLTCLLFFFKASVSLDNGIFYVILMLYDKHNWRSHQDRITSVIINVLRKQDIVAHGQIHSFHNVQGDSL